MVSIIIPVFNTEKYLRECINSVVNQTYSDIEVILVDDGSTDQSSEICDEYAEKDSRIIVIHRENGGQADAKNSGLSVACGSYVFFLDSDDYIRLDTIECLVQIAVAENSEMVFFAGQAFTEDVDGFAPSLDINHEYSTMTGAKAMIYRIDNNEMMPGGELHIYSMGFLKRENLTFAKGIIYEDVLFSTIAYVRAGRVTGCTEQLYYYRIHSGSTMNSKPKPYNLFCYLECMKGMAAEKERYEFGTTHGKKGKSQNMRYTASAFMFLYGELEGAERSKVSSALRDMRNQLRNIHMVSCRKKRIEYRFPRVWLVYNGLKKKMRSIGKTNA